MPLIDHCMLALKHVYHTKAYSNVISQCWKWMFLAWFCTFPRNLATISISTCSPVWHSSNTYPQDYKWSGRPWTEHGALQPYWDKLKQPHRCYQSFNQSNSHYHAQNSLLMLKLALGNNLHTRSTKPLTLRCENSNTNGYETDTW